jgi:hypothetical protein
MAIEGNKFINVPAYYQIQYGTDIIIEGRKVTPPFRGNVPPR